MKMFIVNLVVLAIGLQTTNSLTFNLGNLQKKLSTSLGKFSKKPADIKKLGISSFVVPNVLECAKLALNDRQACPNVKNAQDCKNAGCCWTGGFPFFNSKGPRCYRKKSTRVTMKNTQCRCSADSHCYSFDGKKLDFSGACQYTMVQDGCKNGVHVGGTSFRVIIDFHRKNNKKTWIKAVHVEILKHLKVSILPSRVIKVNGVTLKHFPAKPLKGMTIWKNSQVVGLLLPNKVFITASFKHHQLYVQVPTFLTNKLCGMCGNLNGSPDDDWTMGDGNGGECLGDSIEEGQIATTAHQFGASWLAAIDADQGCDEECDTVEPPVFDCPLKEQKDAEEHCSELTNREGRFRECVGAMDKDVLDGIVFDCVNDTCSAEDPDDEFLCAQAETLIELCTNKYGLEVSGWRNEQFCPLTCPEHQVYKACGSLCQPTCADRQGEQGGECDVCMEGCFCEDGYLSDGDTCIQPEECGCSMDGILYEVGETVLSSDCSKVCTCSSSQTQMLCRPSGCDENSLCTVKNDKRQCICPPGYRGDGKTCTRIIRKSQCKCLGDPHCHSFDGKKLDFMGACQYTMVQDGCVDGVHSGGTTFRVITDFYRRKARRAVTWIKGVFVDIVGSLGISLLGSGEVKVGGIRINHFPASIKPNVNIRKRFGTVVIRFSNHIEIKWVYWHRKLSVSVPDTLEDTLCGLCGNYDGTPIDDWIMGDANNGQCINPGLVKGQIAPSAKLFGVSWLAALDDDAGCPEECDEVVDPPPECVSEDQVAARIHCKELSNHLGRFQDCIGVLDDSELLDIVEDCEFDTCIIGDPNDEFLCTQAETLVELCEEKYGIHVKGWRDSQFCPLTCPERMVYKDCGSICEPTCADRQGKQGGECEDVCEEGCFCADGYLADGDTCILPEDCGCIMDGILFEVGETVKTDNCTQICTCTPYKSEMECTPLVCDKHSECTIVGGESKCVCKTPYIGDGFFCTHPICNASPPNCVVTDQGQCVANHPRQTCGIGIMTEHRTCYDTAEHQGAGVKMVINRKCCIEKCLAGAPGTGIPPEITCHDVYPNC